MLAYTRFKRSEVGNFSEYFSTFVIDTRDGSLQFTAKLYDVPQIIVLYDTLLHSQEKEYVDGVPGLLICGPLAFVRGSGGGLLICFPLFSLIYPNRELQYCSLAFRQAPTPNAVRTHQIMYEIMYAIYRCRASHRVVVLYRVLKLT